MPRNFSRLYRMLELARVKIKIKKGLTKFMEDDHTTNRLVLYRKRMKFSQKKVAQILGLKNVSMLSHYERGTTRPSLERALGLEIIYRVPVAFLFPELYEGVRSKVREREDRMTGVAQ